MAGLPAKGRYSRPAGSLEAVYQSDDGGGSGRATHFGCGLGDDFVDWGLDDGDGIGEGDLGTSLARLVVGLHANDVDQVSLR